VGRLHRLVCFSRTREGIMDWFQFSIFLLFISTIGLGIIHGIEKIARILDHHFHKDQE
jgi:hypothetical protein